MHGAVLWQEGDSASEPAAVPGGNRGPVEIDPAGARSQEPRSGPQQGGLARAIGADHAQHLAVRHSQLDAAHDLAAAKSHRDVRKRVRDLRAVQSAPPSQSRAVNGDDEFDAVFNDLFEGK